MRERVYGLRWALVLGGLVLGCGAVGAGDWARFRGPDGTGVAADKGVPVKWTDRDVLWKTAIPGVGHSSPIVSAGRVFLQSASEDGDKRMLLCLDAASGDVLWTRDAPGTKARTHPKNSLASSTPAADGERVYAVFWDGREIILCAYDFAGKQLWKKDLGGFRSQHGAGLSPIVHGGKVFLNNDQDGSAAVLAFDAKTGEKAWEARRKAFRTCYSTPFILTRGGHAELIVGSTAGITSYDPDTGHENYYYRWSFATKPLRTVASPIAAGGLVFANSGDGDGSRDMIAVKLGGKGDVTRTNFAWENRKSFPYVPCLLASGDYLYSVADNGFAACHVARTGEEVWRQRLGNRATFSASPVLVDGKVYAASEDGTVYVFEAAPKFKLLAKNAVGERVSSTPAVADGRLYVRGKEHLFCVGKPAAKGVSRSR